VLSASDSVSDIGLSKEAPAESAPTAPSDCNCDTTSSPGRSSPGVLSAPGDITVEADIGLLSEGTPAESAHTDAAACAYRKSALAWAISTAVFIVLASSFSSYRIRLAFR